MSSAQETADGASGGAMAVPRPMAVVVEVRAPRPADLVPEGAGQVQHRETDMSADLFETPAHRGAVPHRLVDAVEDPRQLPAVIVHFEPARHVHDEQAGVVGGGLLRERTE